MKSTKKTINFFKEVSVMKKRLLSLLVAGGMALSLAACGGGASSAPATTAAKEAKAEETKAAEEAKAEETKEEKAQENSDEPIIVGFMGWSSGPDAMYGLVPQYLLEYYFKNVNANGGWLGRQIDFRTYDISGLDGDFSEAVNVANKLIQSGADIILGPSNSTQGQAVAELCNNAGVLHIPSSPAQGVTVADDGSVRDYTYRSGAVLDDLTTALANYMYYEKDAPKIAVLYETTQIDCVDMYENFEKVYKELGGEITGVSTYQINDIEFRAQITSLANDKPDYIYMPAMGYKELGFAAMQIEELGYDIKLIGTNAMDNQDIVDQAGSSLEGSMFLTEGDVNDEKFADIRDYYNEYYGYTGMSLHIDGLVSLNEAKIAECAVTTAGSTDADAMRKALDECTDLDLITTHIDGFDPDTHNLKGIQFLVKEYQDGTFVSCGNYSVPEK